MNIAEGWISILGDKIFQNVEKNYKVMEKIIKSWNKNFSAQC